MPFTAETEEIIPVGGKTKMPTRLQFRGTDRKRLKELLRWITIIEKRDGKVGPFHPIGSSMFMAVFNDPTFNPNLPGAVTQIRNRINHLLTLRV